MTKQTITTETKYKWDAESEMFSWDSSFDGFLTHKPTGKQIYQMMWYEYKNSQPIDDETIVAAAKEFWAALRVAQDADEAAAQAALDEYLDSDDYRAQVEFERKMEDEYSD